MKIIVTGSRTWEGVWGEGVIQGALTKFQELSTILNSPLTIVHGGCPTGADAITDRWARRRDIEPIVFPANWSRGAWAGPFRNEQMLQGGGDMVLAFIRDHSRGATNCVQLAEKYRIPAFVVRWEE